MNSEPFKIDVYLNSSVFKSALIDNGCLCYATISERVADSLRLPRIPISPRALSQVTESPDDLLPEVSSVTYADIDIDGHKQRAYFYVIPGQKEDLILGQAWMKHQDVRISPRNGRLTIGVSGTKVWNRTYRPLKAKGAPMQINAAAFSLWTRKATKDKTVQIFKASLADIEKALRPKPKGDPEKLLPAQYREFLQAFSREAAERLPLPRKGIDHKIPLERDEKGVEKQAPWGPLYAMSREELLVLRKTLTELLDKNFIRVSQSLAAAPVLFARKPGGGL